MNLHDAIAANALLACPSLGPEKAEAVATAITVIVIKRLSNAFEMGPNPAQYPIAFTEYFLKEHDA